jgi:hypothetical protein
MTAIRLRCSQCRTVFICKNPDPPAKLPCPQCRSAVSVPDARIRAAAWSYQRQGEQFGPVTYEDLQILAADGGLLPTDLVHTQGMSKWAAAKLVPQLFAGHPESGPPSGLGTPRSGTALGPRSATSASGMASPRSGTAVNNSGIMTGSFTALAAASGSSAVLPAALPASDGASGTRSGISTPAASWLMGGVLACMVAICIGAAVTIVYLLNKKPTTPVVQTEPPDNDPPVPLVVDPPEVATTPPEQPSTLPAPPPAVPTTPTGPRIVAPLVDPTAPVVRDAGPVLVLSATATPFNTPSFMQRSVLAREILRQAVLMAAREGLGLTTRDGNLREAIGQGMQEATLDAVVLFVPQRQIELNVMRTLNARSTSFGSVAFLQLGSLEYDKLLQEVEPLTRPGTGSLPELLTRAGFSGQPYPIKPTGTVPAALEEQLGRMNIADQFGAVRTLHQLCKTEGESPPVLAALARGYAHLGLLTEHYWAPTHKIFKARALLYAQRLLTTKDDAWGRWHRAYAATLAGLIPLANADIVAARKFGGTEPAWSKLLDARLKHDVAGLTVSLPDARLAELLALLHFQTVFHPQAKQITLQTAQTLLQRNPACYYAYDLCCEIGGTTNLRRTFELSAKALQDTFPLRVQTLGGPPSLNEKDLPKLHAALVEAGMPKTDQQDFGWSVLGRMLQDELLVQAQRKFTYLREQSRPAPPTEVEAVLPPLAGHPYEEFIRSFAFDRVRQKEQFVTALQKVNSSDGDWGHQAFFQAALLFLPPERTRPVGQHWYANMDATPLDLRRCCEAMPTGQAKSSVNEYLRRLDPLSPYSRSILVQYDWNKAKEHAETFEREAGTHAPIFLALGKKYRQIDRDDLALSCFQRAVALSADYESYHELAECYLKKNDLPRWRGTLDEYLAKNDQASEQAKARVELAKFLLVRGEVEMARKYAEEAAKANVDDALICASECAEAAQDFTAAEVYRKRLSELAPYRHWYGWYSWCARTGKGDLAGAKKVADEHLRKLGNVLATQDKYRAAFYYAACGDDTRAVDWLYSFTQDQADPATLFTLAVWSDANKRATVGLPNLDRIADGRVNDLTKMAELLRDGIRQNGKLDFATVDAELRLRGNSNYAYLIGKLLDTHGHKADALRYYDQCATATDAGAEYRMLATMALRKHGTEPGKVPTK